MDFGFHTLRGTWSNHGQQFHVQPKGHAGDNSIRNDKERKERRSMETKELVLETEEFRSACHGIVRCNRYTNNST